MQGNMKLFSGIQQYNPISLGNKETYIYLILYNTYVKNVSPQECCFIFSAFSNYMQFATSKQFHQNRKKIH